MQQLLQQFSQAVNVWRAMAANGAVLDYQAAAEIISTSEQMAKAVYRQCQKVRKATRLHRVVFVIYYQSVARCFSAVHGGLQCPCTFLLAEGLLLADPFGLWFAFVNSLIHFHAPA